MYDHILEEMADAIAKDLNVESNDVLGVLNRYWQDKIAHVWQVDDMLEAARRVGKLITRTDAAALLYDVFEQHNSSLGISWTSLEVALENYHLDLKSWPAEKYAEIHGIFKVWRKGNLIAHQFGMAPGKCRHGATATLDGNLPDALALAKSRAKETPGIPVFIGCEIGSDEDPTRWLRITLHEGETEPLVEVSEEPCTQ